MFAHFVGFKKFESTLHSLFIFKILFILCAIWPHLHCVRSQLRTLIKSVYALPRFRQFISYGLPYSSDDTFSRSRFFFTFFLGTSECDFWMMLLISLSLDLKFTVLTIFSWTLFSLTCEAVGLNFFSLVPQYLTFFHKMSRAVQHACFGTVRLVTQTVCIFSFAIASAALLELNGDTDPPPLFVLLWLACFSSAQFFVFRKCSPFVKLFPFFCLLEHFVGLPVSPGFEIPPL